MIAFCWRNDCNYYYATVYRDMLNNWILLRKWGSKNSKYGRRHVELVPSLEAAYPKFKAIHQQRIRQGYQLISTTTPS